MSTGSQILDAELERKRRTESRGSSSEQEYNCYEDYADYYDADDGDSYGVHIEG